MPSKARLATRVAVAALVAFVAVQALLLVAPTVYPRTMVTLLHGVSPYLEEDLTLLDVAWKGTEATFLFENRLLSRFRSPNGNSGPHAELDYVFEMGILNAYPLMVLPLLASVPFPVRRRLRLLGLGLAALAVIGLADLIIIYLWMGAMGLQDIQAATGFPIAATPENQVELARTMDWINRLTFMKSALSAGGRQFLAAMAVGLCLLIIRPGRAEPSQNVE